MSPQNNEYEGRHRPSWERVEGWMAMQADALGFQRDHRVWWFGYEYTPRHSADFREVSA